MKNKKGAELSVNIIIIAIISLLVLVIVITIFTGKMAQFIDFLSGKCPGRSGQCTSQANCAIESNDIWVGAKDCTGGTICCIPRKTK